MGAALAARANARRDQGGRGFLGRPKTAERILGLRSQGKTVERIAQELRLVVAEVSDFIKISRRRGDPRALTDAQCKLAPRPRAVEIDAPPEAAAAPAAAPPPAPRPRRVPKIVRVAVDPFGLDAYVARIRGCAKIAGPARADAAAGLNHLADLHEHCPTFYPTYVVQGDGTTLEATRRRFPEHREGRASGSPSAACLEG